MDADPHPVENALVPRLPAAFLPLMHRHAEDTGAAVAEVTWAVSSELASEVLTEVTWRAFTEVTLAMERAFAEVALQF
jgi:hypothetical protein